MAMLRKTDEMKYLCLSYYLLYLCLTYVLLVLHFTDL